MKTSEYWAERFTQLENAQHQIGVQTLLDIEKAHIKAERELEAQISTWYQRFADNNKISLAEAKQYLNASDLKELKWDLAEYIKHGEENALDGRWMKELENASAKYHISKLEALKIRSGQTLEVLANEYLGDMSDGMSDVYKSGYYHSIFEIQKGMGIGFDIGSVDQDQIEKIISKPWAVDGKNFSSRIWENKNKLINTIHQDLTQGIMLGQDPAKTIDSIARKMNTSKNNAGRLVMTEEAYFSSLAQKDAFKQLDVERFEIVATLDSHTSELCRTMDGKVFEMKDYEPGTTAPPFHVYCRSTTVPYFEDDFGVPGERAARGEDGKLYYVPANMTYRQWEKKFVGGGSKSGLKAANPGDILKVAKIAEYVDETQSFAELKQYLKDKHNIVMESGVEKLDFQSVREGLSGVEYVIDEFPQAKSSFKNIGIKKNGLMCAGYEGDINFNPGIYETRQNVLFNHGLAPGTKQSGLHPKGNNAYGSGCHEAGHILEKALIDKINGGESLLGRIQWQDETITKSIVSDACKAVKKLPECKGKTNNELKAMISRYAKTSASECLAEAICDVSLNGEDAAPLSKAIWDILKKELG